MVKHVSIICRIDLYQIRQLLHTHRYSNIKATSTFVNSFIMNCIDYCISLLEAAPGYQTDQLQR